MSTVTYKHQPAIHATRGAVPLAGNSHLYTVKKVLWPESIEDFLDTLLIGNSLHVCCGLSKLGNVRLDLDENVKPDIIGDAANLPFADNSFDTVLIDMPYNGRFQWMHNVLSEIARVAKLRLVFQHWFLPANKYGLYKKDHSLVLTATYIWQPQTYFGRVNVISVFDRIGEND